MADIQKIAEEISSLTLLEARDLVKSLEEKLGIKAAAPMAMAAIPVAGELREPRQRLLRKRWSLMSS